MATTMSGPAREADIAELTRRECLMLLATHPVGRIVYTAHGLPAVIPVNFLVDSGAVNPGAEDQDVLVCCVRGGWLLASIDQAVVGLEADRLDSGLDAGWWVTAVGRVEQVRDEREAAALRADPRWPRPIGESEWILLLRPELATGRRIVTAAQDA